MEKGKTVGPWLSERLPETYNPSAGCKDPRVSH